ncbi:MAG: leucine-rich repeat domain-containing protein, partial [Clostridia bacterium]|nr:leucine-rich repeat domain-containing protein [Clostridia bacterium]
KFGNIFGDVNSNDCVPSSLKTVVITGDYDIGSYAFEECTGIESVIIEGDLTAIKQYAFASCSALKEVFVGDSVQTIEACVFENCGALERVIIPRSVTTIGNAAFYQCANFQSVYYKGTKSEWNAISIGTYNDNNSKLNDANKYYYSQTQPTAVDYLNNNKKIDTWHYDNGEVALWQINLTNGVDAKTFNYTSSEVEVSDNYWQMLLSAKAQNALDMFFGDDQTQIDMVTSSESKADYEGKLATYYATSATALSVSFADGKATLAQTSDSTQLDYIEVDNEVYYVLTKTQAFVFDEANNRLLERMATEYVTVTHNYLLAQ